MLRQWVLQNLSTIHEEAETELAESGNRNDPEDADEVRGIEMQEGKMLNVIGTKLFSSPLMSPKTKLECSLIVLI